MLRLSRAASLSREVGGSGAGSVQKDACDSGSIKGAGSIGSHDHNDGSSIVHGGGGRERSREAGLLRLARQDSIRSRDSEPPLHRTIAARGHASTVSLLRRAREGQPSWGNNRRASVDKNHGSSANVNHFSSATGDVMSPSPSVSILDLISPMSLSPGKPTHRKTTIERPPSLAGGGGVCDIQVAGGKEKLEKPVGFHSMLPRISQSEEEHSAFHSSSSINPCAPIANASADISCSFRTGSDPLGIPINLVSGIPGLVSTPPVKKKMRKLSSRDNLVGGMGKRYHVLVVDDSGMVKNLIPLPSPSLL